SDEADDLLRLIPIQVRRRHLGVESQITGPSCRRSPTPTRFMRYTLRLHGRPLTHDYRDFGGGCCAGGGRRGRWLARQGHWSGCVHSAGRRARRASYRGRRRGILGPLMATDGGARKTERLLDLLVTLLNADRPIPFAELRDQFPDYKTK